MFRLYSYGLDRRIRSRNNARKKSRKVSIRRVQFAFRLHVGLTERLQVRAGLKHDGCTVIDLIGSG